MTIGRKRLRSEREVLDALRESKQTTRRFEDDYDQLLKAHPDHWVAVSKDDLVAHHKELSGVIAGFREKGYRNTQAVVKFLDTDPPGLLLCSPAGMTETVAVASS